MSELNDLLEAWTDERTGARLFTMHLDFMAVDEAQARIRAEAYARALNYVRVEVDCFTARVSMGENWSNAMPVFCGSPGPDPSDVCTDVAGHPGFHHGCGATGQWGEPDVPAAPDHFDGPS